MGFWVKSNLRLTFREGGKIVARREGHNIWLDFGRVYLASLLGYTTFSPLTPEQDNRIAYIGFGIGGTKQNAYPIANNNPMLGHYPGTNINTDAMPGLLALERPVRFSWATGPVGPPYDAGDVWMKQVQVPTHPTTSSSMFSITVASTDINGSYYLAAPLSEIGLFHRGANINLYDNSPVAYDTFDTVQKTGSYDLNVSWTIRF